MYRVLIIQKPFGPLEFLARINALFRRVQGNGFNHENVMKLSDEVTINFDTREVFVSGQIINLTPIEYRLLKVLVRNKGRVLTHRTLLEKAWGPDYIDDRSYLKKYMYRLRQKLERNSLEPHLLLTERGIGYRLNGHI